MVSAVILAFAVAVPATGDRVRGALEARADDRALLVVAEDANGPDERSSPWRAEERRADAILLVRWLRSCARLQVISIPRDLVVRPGTQTLSITYGADGPRALTKAIEHTFGVRIVGRVALDLADVRALADALGPVVVPLATASRDLHTGFTGGPGLITLDGDRTIAFLRSRTWEEWRDQQWVLASASDLGRMSRAQEFGLAALAKERAKSLVGRLRFGVLVLRRGGLTVSDELSAAGFASGLNHVRDIQFDTVAVRPERTVDERRSPFAPNDLGAMARYVLVSGEAERVHRDTCATTEAAAS
jgi:LCP family protein required for cell wall assembly